MGLEEKAFDPAEQFREQQMIEFCSLALGVCGNDGISAAALFVLAASDFDAVYADTAHIGNLPPKQIASTTTADTPAAPTPTAKPTQNIIACLQPFIWMAQPEAREPPR